MLVQNTSNRIQRP